MIQNTILYIDDEPLNLSGFTSVFWNHYNILTATTTHEGYDILKQNTVKVLITDQRMPGETGLEFIKRTKNEFPNLVCILLTGFADMGVIIDALNSGSIYRFVLKPWDKTDLSQSINNAIQKFDMERLNQDLIKNLEDKNTELGNKNKELLKKTKALKDAQSELKAKNDELFNAKEMAEEGNRLKSSFLANISHEVRTPLNGIVGFSELLKNNVYDIKKQESFVDLILQSSYQLLKIMNDIVELSQIESANQWLQVTEFKVSDLVTDLTYYAKDIERNNNISFQVNNLMDNQDQTLTTDRNKLFEALRHILDNAFKFIAEGKVTLECQKLENAIRFAIHDTGIGIAPKDHERIFMRFIQLEDGLTRKYGGNGLGLTLAQKYTELLNGRIWLRSELKQGSSFYLDMPCTSCKLAKK